MVGCLLQVLAKMAWISMFVKAGVYITYEQAVIENREQVPGKMGYGEPLHNNSLGYPCYRVFQT